MNTTQVSFTSNVAAPSSGLQAVNVSGTRPDSSFDDLLQGESGSLRDRSLRARRQAGAQDDPVSALETTTNSVNILEVLLAVSSSALVHQTADPEVAPVETSRRQTTMRYHLPEKDQDGSSGAINEFLEFSDGEGSTQNVPQVDVERADIDHRPAVVISIDKSPLVLQAQEPSPNAICFQPATPTPTPSPARQIVEALHGNWEIGETQQANVLHIKLRPEELGEIELTLSSGSDGMTIAIITDTDEAARLLSFDQSHLDEALAGLGIEMVDGGVSISVRAAGVAETGSDRSPQPGEAGAFLNDTPDEPPQQQHGRHAAVSSRSNNDESPDSIEGEHPDRSSVRYI